MSLKDGKYQVKIKNGGQYWRDANGNVIHYKDSDGFEYWREYDANGNCIHIKYSSGYEYWREYDANGNVIHYRNSNGNEYWRDYDANGNCIRFRNSNGNERWYGSDGKRITKKEFDKIHNKKSDSCEGTVVEVMGKKYKLTAV